MPRVASTKKTVKTAKAYRPRTSTAVRGRGDYTYGTPGPVGRAGRSVGAYLGGKYGGAPGREIGAAVGGLAHYAGKVFGSGDYQVGAPPSRNSLFTDHGSKSSISTPGITFGEGTMRVKHREFMADIVTSATAGLFSTTNYQVNPGLMTTFPWLSSIASAYQSYRFNGLVLEYKSTSGLALSSTNTAQGTVILAYDANPSTLAQPFFNKQEMMSYAGSVSCRPSEGALLGVECDPVRMQQSEFYVRTGALPAGQDIRLNDPVSLSIATVGNQGASVKIGESFIVYDVTFFNPGNAGPASGTMMAEYTWTGNRDVAYGNNLTNNAVGLFGSNASSGVSNAVKIVDTIGIGFGYSAILARAFVYIDDPSSVPVGARFICSWQCNGVLSSTLGRPYPVYPIGTTGALLGTDGTGNFLVGGPSVSTTAEHSSVEWSFTVTDPSILHTDTNLLGGPFTTPYAIAALINTQVPSATTSVTTSSGTIIFRMFMINPSPSIRLV